MSVGSPLPFHPDVQIESDERVWSGRFALDVVRFRHRRFDGRFSRVRTWELWRRGRAAAVLPYDPVADAVVLIEQFRLPALAAGVDPVMVEVPAGLCDGRETPEATVRREVKEEMGLEAGLLHPIGTFVLTPGGCDEACSLFAGSVSVPEAGPDGIAGHAGMADEDEDIRVRVWNADEAIRAALDGKFQNSVTMIALLWLNGRRQFLREIWTDDGATVSG